MNNTLPTLIGLEGASTFSQVTISKENLLAAIVDNKKTHDEIYANALEGYYKSIREDLQKKLDLIPMVVSDFKAAVESINPESGEPVDLTFKHQYNLFNFKVPFPVSHEEDYNRAIRMVEMSASELFKLTQEDFAKYVMNDWDWKREFVATNSMYLSGIAPQAAMRKFAG